MEHNIPLCCEDAGGFLPQFYAKCSYFSLEFFDKGAFVYSQMHPCTGEILLDCDDEDTAQQLTMELNRTTPCPICGRHKWKAMTQFDIMNEANLVGNIAKASLNGN